MCVTGMVTQVNWKKIADPRVAESQFALVRITRQGVDRRENRIDRPTGVRFSLRAVPSIEISSGEGRTCGVQLPILVDADLRRG